MQNKLPQVVSAIAPVLGAALSPLSPIASLLIKGLGAIFGADNPDDLAAKIASDPDAAVKIRQFELEHENIIVQTNAQIRLAAYDREIKVTQGGDRNFVMKFLALFVVISFFGLCLIVAFTTLDKTDHDIFYMLLGVFGSKFGSVIDYFFGSSSEKTPIYYQRQNDIELPPPAKTR